MNADVVAELLKSKFAGCESELLRRMSECRERGEFFGGRNYRSRRTPRANFVNIIHKPRILLRLLEAHRLFSTSCVAY